MRMRPGGNRVGFTMVELMVAVAIILVLLTVSAAAYFRFTGAQQASNTKTALSKITLLLKRRWNAVAEDAYRIHPMPLSASGYISKIAGPDPATQRVIWVKLRLRQEFPMSFDEALNPPPQLDNEGAPSALQPLPVYYRYLSAWGIDGSSANNIDNPKYNNNYESAACLLMALQRTDSGGGYTADQLGTGAVEGFPAHNKGGTATGKQVKALVDGWGSPLAFYRAPWGSTELNPGPPGPPSGPSNDTTDPQGLLSSPGWQGNQSYKDNFNTVFLYAPASPAGNSFRLQPLIVSPGPDRKLGLDLKSAATVSSPPSAMNDSKDNLSNADM